MSASTPAGGGPAPAVLPGAEGKVANRPKILVVEDEEHLAEGISLNLDAEGYAPVLARTGPAAIERWRRGGIDLIVLDVMLPEMSGFTVCEQIRRAGGRLPILFLTAKGRAEDRVRGLEIGGDDYMTKPFHLKEFLLRVKALLRRQEWARPGALEQLGRIQFGPCEVDFRTLECVERSGQRERLTDREAAILRLLIERGGAAVSRAEIMEKLWPEGDAPTARTIDNFIVRLRKRFEEDATRPRLIQTVFGVGYRFVV
ncbi:MAG TPA: response regulator transcription factor [Planctomycetota bacterium]|nr:response regulator transcription factor [Planctomycetota bacterium]